MRKIEKILPSPRFWEDLAEYRKTKHYPTIRQNIGRFVSQLSCGEETKERGFSNPKLKGVMHLKVCNGVFLMHTYPDPDTLRLCMVVDHSIYGYKGKHKSREGQLAARIFRNPEMEIVQTSPEWPDLTWKTPEDISSNNDLHELSINGLHRLLESIDYELDNFEKLKAFGNFSHFNSIPEDFIEDWGERLIAANDAVCEAIEESVSPKPKPVQDILESWMEP